MSEPIVCTACGAEAPASMRFCGSCGARLGQTPAGDTSSRTQFFGAMQAPGRAKLILIRGDGLDGVSYMLSGRDHVVGRTEGAILFPDDPFLSPRHANFLCAEGKLWVSDEGSLNGVYVRIRRPMAIPNAGSFLVGEQILVCEACAPDLGPQPDDDGTYFYASPRRPSRLRLLQRLRGGDTGLIFRARADVVSIGRENNDVNFPDDPFISGRHAQVEAREEEFVVTDLGSKNGTFVRISSPTELGNGDYVFLGQQLLRVEIS